MDRRQIGPTHLIKGNIKVKDSFVFDLPAAAIPIRAHLQTTRMLKAKEYLATFKFDTGHVEDNAQPNTPKNLQWSQGLQLPFSYIPAGLDTQNTDFKQSILPWLVVPAGTTTVNITIHPWEANKSNQAFPFKDAVLEIDLLGRPSLILAKAGTANG